MSTDDWDAEATLFQYPPLEAPGADQPQLLLRGSLRACIDRVAGLDDTDRMNIEIETTDGAKLLNAADIARMLTGASPAPSANLGIAGLHAAG